MAHTFDASKLNSPRIPPNIPLGIPDDAPLPSAHEGPYLSFEERKEGAVDDDVRAQRRSGAYGSLGGKDTYKKYFGRFGTGRLFRTRSIGGWFGRKKLAGLETKFKAFRMDPSGKGRNLSDQDIDIMVQTIENEIRKLPSHMSRHGEHRALPPYVKQKILAQLWQKVQSGKISRLDFADAQKIVDHIEM